MRQKSFAIPIIALLVVSTVIVPTETVSGYDGTVHTSITRYAGEQFANYFPNTEPLQYLETIAYGAWEEDESDVVFGYDGDYKTVPHFWDADSGPFAPVNVYLTVEDWPNAWQKISHMRVEDYDSVSPYGLWDQALLDYASGNKQRAYCLLGHIAHLIQDMSVPAHVHEDAHPTSDYYEDTLNKDWDWVSQRLDQDELKKGLIDYSNILVPSWTPSLSAIYYLLYTTNQRTDFFGSEGEPGDTDYARGDIVDPMGWIDPGYWPSELLWYCTPGNMEEYNLRVCNMCKKIGCIGIGDSCSEWCPFCGSHASLWDAPDYIAAKYTLVYAIRATATLFEIFLKEVDKAAPTTSISFVNRYITSDDQVYISPDTQFTLTAIDDATGVKVTEYRVMGGGDDSDWKVYSAPFTFNQFQAGLADGPYTILYRSADSADHLETDKCKAVYLTTRSADYRVSLSTGGSYLGIQAAIDAAQNGTTIEVKPGTFRECVDFKGKTIVLRSIGGAEVTTIDAGGGLHVVTFAKRESRDTILDGFTITGGNASGDGFPAGCGGGILCSAAQPTIRNCIITDNTAKGDGGGLYFVTMYPVLQNCLIHHNSASNGGGLLSLYSQPTITNCTFSANQARGGLGGAIASFASVVGNTPILYNCILSGDLPWEIVYSTVSPIVWNCDVQQDHVWLGGNNLKTDPKFVDANNGNFRLAADSPCIGVGDNNAPYQVETDLDGHPRKLDGRCDGTAVVDMGAYEFNYAYKGDLDYNCTVDFEDLARLVSAWMDEPPNPAIDIAPGPDGDGVINLLDFGILADHWLEVTP